MGQIVEVELAIRIDQLTAELNRKLTEVIRIKDRIKSEKKELKKRLHEIDEKLWELKRLKKEVKKNA